MKFVIHDRDGSLRLFANKQHLWTESVDEAWTCTDLDEAYNITKAIGSEFSVTVGVMQFELASLVMVMES